MKLCPPSRKSGSPAERGYVLITLILFVALLAISLTALAPVFSQQIKRDREEELIHRGTQYSRALKHYMKKFNTYPNRIEDLESSNNIRFLRRRYKDPVTGKDFKLLHQNDVQIAIGPGIVGASPVAGAAGNGGNATSFGGSGVFGGGGSPGLGGNSSGGLFGNNSGGPFGGSPGGNSTGPFGGGGNSGGPFGGGNSGGNGSGPFGGSPGPGGNINQDNGSDVAPGQPASGQGGFGQPVQNLPGGTPPNSGTGTGTNNQVFGGGPIVGVASVSPDKSIRSFSKKDHYKDWQFIYDPTSDRGGLITTPYQAMMQTGMQNLNGNPVANGTNGTPGLNGAPGSSAGPPSAFGRQPGGMAPQAPAQSPQ